MVMAVDLGTGTTLTFGTSSFTIDVMSVDGSGNETREAIRTSHMGTTGTHTYTPSDIMDGGTFTVEGNFDGTQDPPTSGAVETITIDWGGSGYTWAFDGFITEFSPSAPFEDKMSGSFTIQVAGAITKVTS